MARLLVVYATRYGHTARVAEHIAATLRMEGHSVEVATAARFSSGRSLDSFDAVLVGAPILGGTYGRAVKRFLREHREELAAKHWAFFSVGLSVIAEGGRIDTEKALKRYLDAVGVRPTRTEFFAGALTYTRYNPLVRFLMRRIVARQGGDTDTSRDYEYTNWDAVSVFARDFARELGPAPESLPEAPTTRPASYGESPISASK
ncbi:MAG: flavodoxin domain-containing protein [Pseudomonadota bacterium]